MKKHALLAFELECFFGSALGARAQTYDACGLNASPDPEAGITDQVIQETGRHRRVRAVLIQMPKAYAVLAEAYSPRRPLPPQVLHGLGGEEPIARLVLHSWSLREAFTAGDEGPDLEAFLVKVARGGAHAGLRDRAVEEARLLLEHALDLYASIRRPNREAA